MDPADQLLHIKQDYLSFEKKNVQQYCELSFQVPFDEIALKDIFRYGFNEYIKS